MSLRLMALLAALCVLPFVATAQAQDFGETFSGFSSNSNDPIMVEADRLEVRDNDKVAIYSGNVKVRQAETVLETAKLTVHYSGNPTDSLNGSGGGAGNGGKPASNASATPGSSITRIEAEGGVLVTSENRTATGDRADFEMATDMVTLYGNVVLTEDDNVLRGEKLIVNLKTKKAQMQGGRVQTILAPGSSGQSGQ
ncbi:lipopolysaccharide export system protein LptA [Rhodopseudomonas julia]|uniref:Lipopolysaccharide export system protein LptA n=1 Tax=Rhodopseudomonas julia TaxID=200617 RepID=A0ABU0C427_9BRAD|nr:LptA/OstA family protein [Rhodopseudomonas julia]MDQ0325260.1 lipopolysaccharide export system protein LptA [Rhodopseudomonas julia]